VRPDTHALRERIRSHSLGEAALGAAAGYTRHATSQLAAAISYRVLFSLVPLTAFFGAVAAAVLPEEQRSAVARWLVSLAPGSALDPSVEHALTTSRTTPTIAGLVALLLLLWSASAMMAALRVAFRVIWQNDLRRTYVRSKLLDLALVLGVGLLAIASLGATLLVQILAQVGHDLRGLIGGGTQGDVLAKVLEVLSSAALTFAVLAVLYRTVPPVRPRWRAIWPGALLCAIGFHLAGAGYALYLANYGNVTAVYGPLAAVLGFLLVVYVGVLVILLGAELVAAWPGAGVRADDGP
jgi:membrane protein